MNDTGTDTCSETAERHPSPLRQHLTPEWLTAVFTIVLAVATIVLAGATVALVWTSIKQHADAVEAIEETKRLAEETNRVANATENAIRDKQRTASADFIMKIEAALDEPRYNRIIDDIQSHNSNYHLPKYPNKADADVLEYISNFEDVGYFVADDLISSKIAYERLSYDIEKAWCNITVQETIRDERAADKSKTAQSDPQYGNFARLAKEYLNTDGLTCNQLDNSPAPAAKNQKPKRRQ